MRPSNGGNLPPERSVPRNPSAALRETAKAAGTLARARAGHTQKVPTAQGSPPKKVRRQSCQGACQRATWRTEVGAAWQAQRLLWLWPLGARHRLKAPGRLSNPPTKPRLPEASQPPKPPCCAAVRPGVPEKARHAHPSSPSPLLPLDTAPATGGPAQVTSQPGDGLPLGEHRPASVTGAHPSTAPDVRPFIYSDVDEGEAPREAGRYSCGAGSSVRSHCASRQCLS